MKAVVHRTMVDQDVSVEEVDISTDPDLLDRYGLEIPVLMIDERKVAKYRITESELRRILDRGKGLRREEG
jgi:hypothetical protein